MGCNLSNLPYSNFCDDSDYQRIHTQTIRWSQYKKCDPCLRFYGRQDVAEIILNNKNYAMVTITTIPLVLFFTREKGHFLTVAWCSQEQEIIFTPKILSKYQSIKNKIKYVGKYIYLV
jgi:hypothetical protein